jgi:hypothetical protein
MRISRVVTLAVDGLHPAPGARVLDLIGTEHDDTMGYAVMIQ